jgi:hypothetical protein
MMAILVMVECSTSAVDAADLSAHLEREVEVADRFTAVCEEDDLLIRSSSGRELSIPLADVEYSARARTVALALAEHLRLRDEPPIAAPSPPIATVEEAPLALRPRPWRISGSIEGATTLKADGLLAGAGFDIARTFGWFAVRGDALILGGSSDQKGLLAFIFRAGVAGELPLSETVDLDLGLRIDAGPILGFGGKLSGIFGGGPEIGLRWAFAPPVQLAIEIAGIYTTAAVPLLFLAAGIAYDL